jgi:micrococcal nuclease
MTMTIFPVKGAEKVPASCQHTASRFECIQYIKNYDGDTITVNIPQLHPLFGQRMAVRLKGIDTPEMTSKNACEKEKARTAKKLVENLLSRAKRIDLVGVEREKYFRILADVEADGQNIGHLLLKNHLAVSYDGGTKLKNFGCVSR